MKQVSAFRIDLSKIEGDGEFPCPSCGTPISPEDESEDTYEIVDVETKEDGSIEKLSIYCKKCGSKIHLEGFDLLKESSNLGDLDESDNF
jgi:DNA-directed RNA polymerase subunit RPC12/RpoP